MGLPVGNLPTPLDAQGPTARETRHYHWNVDGRHFFELHAKFEELYVGWAAAADRIAERLLVLGTVPVHTLAGVLDLATLEEDAGVPAAEEMVARIEADLRALHAAAGQVIEAAEGAGDRGTVNLLDELRDGIEADVWMLAAWRKEKAGAWS